MSRMSMQSSSAPMFSTSGSNGLSSPPLGKQEGGNGNNGGGTFGNSKHVFSNPFLPSPRNSPGLTDQRNPDPTQAVTAATAGDSGRPLSRQHTQPIFRPTFTDEPQASITRALDPIAPDQREPFITVESPSMKLAPTPAFRNADGERPYPPVEAHVSRFSSDSGQIDAPDDHLNSRPSVFRQASLGPGFMPRQNSFSNSLTPRHSVSIGNDHFVSSGLSGPPVINTSNIIHDSVLPSSPVSSVSNPSATDRSFDAQIRNHPFLHDILDRVIRTEYAQRDLARELGALTSKINFLVERFEHADPRRSFSGSPIPGNLMGNNNNMSISPLGALPNIGGREDRDINKRLDALTNHVEQILINQQNHVSPNNGPFPNNGPVSPGGFDGPNMNMGGLASLGPPPRPHSRNPPPPVRTWSAGSLDMPLRQDPHLGRPDLLNQKRRSIVGNMNRRDSTATVDSDWGGNSPRDGGPTITKWEHLQLVPDLLRSISKYGVGPPNKIQQRALPFLLNGADIIAQAPPTQERIAAYVIPAIHIALSSLASRPQNRGPIVVIISTTVDQATQAQRMIRDLGGAIGVRSALGVGTGGDVQQEIRLLQQNVPHILCGTPQKLHSLFTTTGGLPGNEVRFLVLDEVDQLIARNLHEFVFNIVKLLPPLSRQILGSGPNGTPSTSPNPVSFSPFGSPGDSSGSPGGSGFGNGRRFPPLVHSPNPNDPPGSQMTITKRQTALFSNTVPQDVLNLANAIQLRDPVRVLVRRDGNVTSSESYKSAGGGLKQFYLYLAFTASGGRIDNSGGLGIIGSGRASIPVNTPETAQAKEWKLEALGDLFDDVEVAQAIVHVGNAANLDAVTYKLASRGLDAIPLHAEMSTGAKMAALNKFRGNNSILMKQQQPSSRVLVVLDVQVKSPDVFQVPLVINYDLPKAVEDYALRVAPAIASSYSRAGVVVNFVTATGGDVEMLRSIECHYKIKCPEVPTSLRDVL